MVALQLALVVSLYPVAIHARWEWVCGLLCERFFPGSYTLNCTAESMTSMSTHGHGGGNAVCQAQDMPYLTSEAWCLHERCEPMGGRNKVEWYWDFIQWELRQNYPEIAAFPEYTAVLPASAPPVLPTNLTVLNATYRVGDEQWNLYYESYRAYNENDIIRVRQGWGYIAGFVGALVIISIWRRVARLSKVPYNPDSWRSNQLFSAIKKHVRYAALFSRRHQVPYLGGLFTAPTRLLSIFVVLCLAVGLILNAVQHRSVQPNSIYANRTNELLNNVGLAAGDLALTAFVLVWLAAARNNPFLWLTGWAYDTFQVLHRWFGRLATLYSLLHTVTYTNLYARRGEWSKAYLTGLWFIWGCVGMVALFVICVFSLRPIRERFYECFFVMHILMAVFAIVGTQLHIIFLYGHHYHYRNWIWAPVTIWSIDRFIRLVRMYVLSSGDARNITVEAVPDTNGTILRLTVPTPLVYTAGAGHYFFLYFPTIGIMFWQNHPISIAGWTKTGSDEEGGKSKSELTMYMLAEKGETGNLAAIVRQNSKPTRLTCLLEGPYGQARPLNSYETVILVAGGVGVGPTLSYVHAHAADPGSTKRLVLLFIARQLGFLREIQRHLRLANLESTVELQLFHSSAEQSQESDSDDEIASKGITDGRPVVAEYVFAEIQAAADGRIAFFVCGPAGLNDAVRYEVVRSIGSLADGDKIAFFEEALGW
ncbi:Ferric-chelate reductase [Mycena indigotica]|uniref:Ferric-chelate reductase n=1 Tax=Mycena indigotica TaxID=2126181 RepID=A0A8H6T8L9_9AGAR|nr:Ferric-chelate reductase [Mycena indigotica]KAF7311967.1 Ferric-chelate reductase [Mycena indigotica]